MFKNNKAFINIKYIKKLFSFIIVFLSLYSSVIILENNFLTLTVAGQPGEPTSFTATAVSNNQINLSWTVGPNSDSTYIEWNTSSSWNFGEGEFLCNYAGTVYSHSNLNAHTKYYYQAWGWDETNKTHSTSYIDADNFTFNTPPNFGTPSPANNSMGVDLYLTWSISISDGDGDTFDWSIECSNGQTNSSTGDSNGTMSLSINGLNYNTLYIVWVNATDSLDTINEWYQFTTKANNPPVFGTPSPVNDSTSQPLSLTWSIPITDPEGDLFSWTIQCSNGQTNSGTGDSNGTKSVSLSGLDDYSTIYTVWVNASDPGGSSQFTREWYQFTTITNDPPVFGTSSPVNGSTGQPLSFTWSIPINDPEGDSFNWSIECSNGQSANENDENNGTKSLSLSGLAYSTIYTVWVNASDSYHSTYEWFSFNTRAYSGGGGGGGGQPPIDSPPLISNISRTPTNITSEDTITISATVTDDTGIYLVYLYWNDGSRHLKEMTFQGNNLYSAEIGPFSELVTVTYWINATDNALQSTESNSYSFKVSDVTGPLITIMKPTPGSIIYDTTPTIKVSYTDPSKINIDSVILTVDGVTVIPQNITESSITYTPTIEMTYSTHTIRLKVSDLLGNSQTQEWSFKIKESDFITEEEIGNLIIDEEKEIKLDKSNETSIESINFKITKNLTNVKISIVKLKDKPEDFIDLPSNTIVYIYLQIGLTANDTDINFDSFNSLKMKFKIKNDWLVNQKIEKNNINLVKYQNNKWMTQETNYLSEDYMYTYYETTMSSFSNLAIVGTKITTEEVASPGFNYIFIVIAVILIIVLIISILFKTGILYIEEENTEEDIDIKRR